MSKAWKIALAATGIVALGITGGALAFGGHGYGGHGNGMGKMLRHADTDNNGEITLEEIEMWRDKQFTQFDSNGDGAVDASEVEGAMLAHMRQRMERHVKLMTRKFDQDRDGKITKEEFSQFAKQRFGWHDLNDDGKLTADEMPGRGRGHGRRHGGWMGQGMQQMHGNGEQQEQ